MSNKPKKEFNTFQYVMKNDPDQIAKEFSLEDSEILSPEERQASLDIMAQYKKKISDLESFLTREFMVFNHKVNQCLSQRCYNDIFMPREEIKECVSECTQGISSADKFVGAKIEQFTKNFSECLEAAQSDKSNIMKESFQCYDKMLNTFEKIKKDVHTEFSFYQ
jgi:Eukaryotic protein of unknown function (DUF842)